MPLLGALLLVQQQQKGWQKKVMSENPGIDTELNLEKESIHLTTNRHQKEETEGQKLLIPWSSSQTRMLLRVVSYVELHH